MDDNSLRNFLKEKLDNYASPVDEAVWERIIAKKDKKRPFFFFWKNNLFIGLGVLLLLGSATYWLSRNSINASNTSTSQQTKPSTTANHTSITEKPIGSLEGQSKQQTKTLNTTVSTEAHASQQKQAERATANTLNHPNEKNGKTLNKQKSNLLPSNLAQTNHQKTINIASKSTSTVSNSTHQQTTHSSQANSFSTASTHYNLGKLNNRNYKALKANKKGISSSFSRVNNANSNEPNVEINGFNTSKTFDYLSTVSSQFKNLSVANPTINKQFYKLPEVECPKDKDRAKNENKWYIEGYSSVDYSARKITENGTSNLYLTKKDSAETMITGFTTGIRLMTRLAGNVFIKTGFQISQIQEEFKAQRETGRSITVIINSRIIKGYFGQDSTVYDTTYNTKVNYAIHKTTNIYRQYELPVLFTYTSEKRMDSKWNWSLTAGAIFNIYSWYEGKTLDNNLNPVLYTWNNTNNPYTSTDFGISAYISGSVYRKLDENLWLFVEPYGRFSLTNEYKSVIGFNQRFNTMGLTFGLRYRFK